MNLINDFFFQNVLCLWRYVDYSREFFLFSFVEEKKTKIFILVNCVAF